MSDTVTVSMPSSSLLVPNNTLSPAALSILGLEQAGFIPTGRESRPACSRGRNGRSSAERRVTSYYNNFSSRTAVSNDAPPNYAAAARQARFPPSPRHLDNGNEILPKYTCTVFKEGPMQVRLESCSPFLVLPFQEWRACYVRIQGTMLCMYKLKTSTVDKVQTFSAGRLMRKYTLQQAEVGIAPDVAHTVLVPQTRLASLIPPLARRKAFEKDPELFRQERHFSLRVRSELDQFVLSNTAEEQVISWVNHIAAGIDIAPDLDSRNVSRQCTMPRRSRRHRPQELPDLTDSRLIEEQRRLLAQYPSLADAVATPQALADSDQVEPTVTIANLAVPSRVEIAIILPDQEQEDIDLSELVEHTSERRAVSMSVPSTVTRPSTLRTNSYTVPTVSASTNFDENGKWSPPHPRTAAQQWRYIRRCMPVLLAETPRHSSVMIDDGRYVRPNYKTDSLEKWALQPPTYEAHDFTEAATEAVTDPVIAPKPQQTLETLQQQPHQEQQQQRRQSTSSSGSENVESPDLSTRLEVRRVDSTSVADDLLISHSSLLTSDVPNLDFKNFGLASDSDEEQQRQQQQQQQRARSLAPRPHGLRALGRSSPNLTMREMTKPGAVLGF